MSLPLDLRTPRLPCPNAVHQSVPSCELRYDSACPWDAPFHLPACTVPQLSRLGNQEVLGASDSRDAGRGADRVPLAIGGTGGGMTAEGQGSCKRGTTAVLGRDLKSLWSGNRCPVNLRAARWVVGSEFCQGKLISLVLETRAPRGSSSLKLAPMPRTGHKTFPPRDGTEAQHLQALCQQSRPHSPVPLHLICAGPQARPSWLPVCLGPAPSPGASAGLLLLLLAGCCSSPSDWMAFVH